VSLRYKGESVPDSGYKIDFLHLRKDFCIVTVGTVVVIPLVFAHSEDSPDG